MPLISIKILFFRKKNIVKRTKISYYYNKVIFDLMTFNKE